MGAYIHNEAYKYSIWSGFEQLIASMSNELADPSAVFQMRPTFHMVMGQFTVSQEAPQSQPKTVNAGSAHVWLIFIVN